MTNNPYSNSAVDYQQLSRGTTSISAVHWQHLSRSLPASQPLTLTASQPWLTAELPLYVVLQEVLNLSGSFEQVVFAGRRSRRCSLVAPTALTGSLATSTQAKTKTEPSEAWGIA